MVGLGTLGQVEYAIFDMDGLLRHMDRSHHLLRKYGYTKPYSFEYKVQTMGRPPRQSAEKTFSFYPGLSDKVTVDEWIEQRNILHEQAFKRVKLLPGALDLVRRLHDAGVPIAIATGSNNKNFKWKTSHLPELFSLFPPDQIFTADSTDITRGKPHPDIYLAAARGLRQDVGEPGTEDQATPTPEQIECRRRGLVFEDAPLGVQAGVAAGMNVIWVPHADVRQLHDGEDLGSQQVLSSLEDFRPERWGLRI